MSAELIITRRDDAIVHVILNRPEKRNALNREALRALVAAVTEAERDRSVRAIVLSGEGRVFSAGVDFTSLKGDVAGETPAPFRVMVGEMQALPFAVLVEGAFYIEQRIGTSHAGGSVPQEEEIHRPLSIVIACACESYGWGF